MGRRGTTFVRQLKKLNGQSRLDLIDQSSYWADQHGNVKRLEKLTPEHRENLYHYLLKNARRLHYCADRELEERWADCSGERPTLQGVEPDEWMRNSPLLCRLAQLIADDKAVAASSNSGA